MGFSSAGVSWNTTLVRRALHKRAAEVILRLFVFHSDCRPGSGREREIEFNIPIFTFIDI
jgi:hypothetical protein